MLMSKKQRGRGIFGLNQSPSTCFVYFVSLSLNYYNEMSVMWSGGVTVSTWDFESQDPSSNLGRTYECFFFFLEFLQEFMIEKT